MKNKKHEKMNLFNSNFETAQEKILKVNFITDKLNYLLLNHTLNLESINVFIGYVLSINEFKIIINDDVYISSDIQTISHYIEKEYDNKKIGDE